MSVEIRALPDALEPELIRRGPLQGREMWLDRDSSDEAGTRADAILDGSFDRHIAASLLERPALTGATVWDVGAGLGTATLMLADQVGPAGHVTAIEADLATREVLARNIERSGDLAARIELVGLAPTDVEDPFASPPVTTLDGLRRAQLQAVALVRIGAVADPATVLRGAKSVLAHDHPILLVHVADIAQLAAVNDLLRDAGYEMRIATDGVHTGAALVEAVYNPPPALGKRRLRRKIMLLAADGPPHPAGQAVVVERMFRDIDPSDYCVVSFRPTSWHQPDLPTLPGKLYEIDSDWHPSWFEGSTERLASVRSTRAFVAEARRRAKRIVDIMRAEDCRALVVTTSPRGAPDSIAAWLACRRTGVPMLIYMLDEWQQMTTVDPSLRVASRMIGRLAIPRASSIVVSTSFMEKEVFDRYGRHSVVVANPPAVEPAVALAKPPRPWPRRTGAVNIVFTGVISVLQADSIVRVVRAVQDPRLDNVFVHLYTTRSRDFADFETGGRLIHHGYQLPDAITEVQRDADILLLPLAFESPRPEIIRSAATTKLSEYLVSGRPLLVHAPRDSFVATTARHHGFAEVVDEPSEKALSDAIYRLIHDPARRAQLVAAAGDYALSNYSTAASVDRFVDAVNGMVE